MSSGTSKGTHSTDVTKEDFLGHGGSGDVFSGTFRGKNVAVKILKEDDEEKFRNEVKTMEELHHPAIVEFISAKFPEIVMELCEFRSLDKAMEQHPNAFKDDKLKSKCLMNAASAMKYLHNRNVVHGDLKPENLLIVSLDPNTSVVAKLSDFGSTCAINNARTRAKGISASLLFMAPEILNDSRSYDQTIDAYSFAYIIFFVLTGHMPFEEIAKNDDLIKAVISGKRPDIPDDACEKDMKELIERCWHSSTWRRPSFDEINSFFRHYCAKCWCSSSITLAAENGIRVDAGDLDAVVSPVSLDFGLGGRRAPVGKSLIQQLSLKNTQKSVVFFVAEALLDNKASQKCSVTFSETGPSLIEAGSEETLTVIMNILCTTRAELELSIKTWKEKETQFKETRIPIQIVSEASTRIDPEDLVRESKIGGGEFAVIYSGSYRGRKVAIKDMLNQDSMSDKDFDFFENEVRMMDGLNHPTIVEFIGAVLLRGRLSIVNDFYEYGSLPSAMNNHPSAFNELLKRRCIVDVSSAMKYLHERDIMHRDVKPSNILVKSLDPDSNVTAVLSDFRTACFATSARACEKHVGAMHYMAPEVHQGSITYDKSIDVFSFAMTMYYVETGKLPFEDDARVKDYGQIPQLIISGKRPVIPDTCPRDIKRLIEQCWNGNPLKRPRFLSIHHFLNSSFFQSRINDIIASGKPGSDILLKTPELCSTTRLRSKWYEFHPLFPLLKNNTIPLESLEIYGL